MIGNLFTVTVHLHGTLAANARGEVALPRGCSLIGVSSSNSAASNAVLDVGRSDDRDGIYAAQAIGNSGAAGLLTPAENNGALAKAGVAFQFQRGEVLAWDLDFDGSSGTPAANAEIVFFFSES
jgi:hypothetical protein